MILSAVDIYKKIGDLEILKGISLEVEKSEIISIVGPSGAGKTTLLNILSTLSLPTSGKVLIDGVDLCKISSIKLPKYRSENIGFVFQSHNLLPEFSALENVAIASLIAGKNKSLAYSEACKLLEMLGLQGRINSMPSTLSGGESQRVAIARALINKPKIVFADEPSGNLDTHGRENLHALFFELREKFGQTFVIVTHDERLADKSDRKIVIRDGRIADVD